MELRKNHPLQGGKYRIIEKIGQGGFAITYKANWSTEVTGPMGKIATDITVAIKEFFFADYCSRDTDTSQIAISSPTGNQIFGKFKEKLKKEAAILSRLRHPNIVSVLDIFEENNTVFMVMEYVSGGSLKDIIRKNGKLDEATTLRYASQLCDAVAEIHRNNVLHLDIKPGNILINPDDKVCLIDFGISKQYNSDTHAETSTTPVGISKGFAPTEQYSGVAQFSPATDIYAIGATIYNMCSGSIPPESMTLFEEDLPHINGISDQLWNAITKAMSIRRNQRPQSVAELVELLPSANNAKEIPSKQPAQQPASAYEKTQIVDQEPASAPTQQPVQPKTPVASNDKTMFESTAHQATYAPTQNASASTSSDDYVDFDSYSDDDTELNGKWCVKSTIAKLIFGLTCASSAFALINYQWLHTNVNWFLWSTLIGMFLTSFYVSFIARKEYRQFSKGWWIRLIIFLSLSTISFVIWANNADKIYLRDAQFIALNILSIIILICHNVWLKRNKKTILAGTILGYIGYSLCFIGALDNSEHIVQMQYDNGDSNDIFCRLSTDSTNHEWYYISSRHVGYDSVGNYEFVYKLVKIRKIGAWECPGWGHHFDGYMEETDNTDYNSIYYDVIPSESNNNVHKVEIWGSGDDGMQQIAEGYISDSIQNQYWYNKYYHSLEYDFSQNEEINLGLPSGTIWIGHNIGVEAMQNPGNTYTIDLVESNESWNLPSATQLKELVDCCTWTIANYRGSIGHKITGPNGKSMFLPAGGNDSSKYYMNSYDFEGRYLGDGNILEFSSRGPKAPSPSEFEQGLVRPVKSN